ncbi:hypothetical protein J1N35_032675 [Gossypium stocksii]|uniref:Uncharacterized protein n=1 Tax=Gossypium stocksii TaxID=47602 RepID=A0A9D3ZVX5_9ROSI|nr:hypothetical protein J1N35_032675 [Gossypium stocksii]
MANSRKVFIASSHPIEQAPMYPFFTKQKVFEFGSLRVLLKKELKNSDFGSFGRIVLPKLSYGQSMGSSPAPLPSNDGTAIDQGIAYILLLLALAITYLIH